MEPGGNRGGGGDPNGGISRKRQPFVIAPPAVPRNESKKRKGKEALGPLRGGTPASNAILFAYQEATRSDGRKNKLVPIDSFLIIFPCLSDEAGVVNR